MDPWNPILAETHVKRVPYWQVLIGEAIAVIAFVLLGAGCVLFVLNLERDVPNPIARVSK